LKVTRSYDVNKGYAEHNWPSAYVSHPRNVEAGILCIWQGVLTAQRKPSIRVAQEYHSQELKPAKQFIRLS